MTQSVQNTREKFRGRIGEVIEAALGLSALKQVFEAAEDGDLEAIAAINAAGAKGEAPSGFLALKMGIVDKETKNALLAAQAAERTLQIMEEIENFYATHVPVMKQLTSEIDAGHPANFRSQNEALKKPVIQQYYNEHISQPDVKVPSFKFIGSAGDPEMLVCSQATHQLAAEYENNEKYGTQHILNGSAALPAQEAYEQLYIDGFKAHTVGTYKNAAKIIQDKGYDVLAKEMTDVASSISFDVDNAAAHTPSNFSRELLFSLNRLDTEFMIYVPDHKPRSETEWYSEIHKRGEQSLRCA